jgi:triosephosphate isomerase
VQFITHRLHPSRPDDLNAEVIIAPPALYVIPILDLLRKDVKVAAQNCHSKTSGAFTGEIRWASPDRPIFLV